MNDLVESLCCPFTNPALIAVKQISHTFTAILLFINLADAFIQSVLCAVECRHFILIKAISGNVAGLLVQFRVRRNEYDDPSCFVMHHGLQHPEKSGKVYLW